MSLLRNQYSNSQSRDQARLAETVLGCCARGPARPRGSPCSQNNFVTVGRI